MPKKEGGGGGLANLGTHEGIQPQFFFPSPSALNYLYIKELNFVVVAESILKH